MKKILVTLSLLSVAACGGATPASTATVGAAASATRGPSAAPGAMPTVAGLLAAMSGNTLQVQNADSQTAVTYGDGTTFTSTTAVTLAEVTVGSCVVVRSAAPTSTPTATPGPVGTGVAGVTATLVSITAPVKGACARPATGGRGSGGMRPSGAPTGPAGGGAPSGAPGGRGRSFGGATFGTVTAVTGATFTVQSVRRAAAGGASQTSGAVTLVSVTTTAATTFSRTERATAAVLKVGVCVTARGLLDSSGSGTLAATSIALRPAVNGSCTTGAATGGQGA